MKTLAILLCLIPLIAFGQIDESKVDEWFYGCRVTASDVGEHNAGTATDVAANWPSASIGNYVKTFVALRHGLGRNQTVSNVSTTYYSALLTRAAAQGVTIPSGVRIVTEGESTTAGTSTWAYNAWPERLMRLPNWVGKGILINQSTGSQTIANIASQYTAQIYPYRPGQGGITSAILIVKIGIADAGANRTAAQMLADVESYVSTAKGHGFYTIVLTTHYNSAYTAGQKQAVLDYNSALLLSSVPDLVIDTVTEYGQPDASPANYADSVHANGDGYDLEAEAINDAHAP
jgi:hypothetical protein